MSRVRYVLFTLLTLVIVYAVIEIILMTAFRVFGGRFTFYSAREYVLSADELERVSGWYDSDLGWAYHYNTPFSERPRRKEYGRPLIAAFGDSYTHCTDVEDAETWEECLSEMIRADVYNFGTGGYGTDQAYLKYLKIAPVLRPEIVVIGITPENINRVVNVYRPFYFQSTGIKLPKPRFVLRHGKLELIPNPLHDAADIKELTRREFVISMGKNDWWFNRDDYPVLGFPYVRIIFNRRIWLEAVQGRKEGRSVDDMVPRPWENLWEDGEASALMFAILDSFIADIHRNGSVPVVMILPLETDVFRRFMTGSDPGPVLQIEEYCGKSEVLCFDSVEALASTVNRMEEIPELYSVHVSAKGNRLIAGLFGAFLRDNGLIGGETGDEPR